MKTNTRKSKEGRCCIYWWSKRTRRSATRSWREEL